MTGEPRIVERAGQPYAALPGRVTMATLAAAIDSGYPELFGWLAARGIPPAGPPLIRYLVVDMDAELEIELGVPVAEPLERAAGGGERIGAGLLPAGRYVSLLHRGPYDGLVGANAALQDWARREGVPLETTDHGRRWRGRAEFYLTDPRAEPDPARWETEVAYLVA